ncbi:MAG: M6 family metalloprotease domain-containing protein [Bacteroidales bacterium]|nr:M6 family metalloprotease domain-containing protein [Bacteroidales bacterium]
MKKFLLTLLFCSIACAFARQVQVKPFTVKQSDGTTLTLVKVGDEHFHYFRTSDGVAMYKDANTNEFKPFEKEAFDILSEKAEQRRAFLHLGKNNRAFKPQHRGVANSAAVREVGEQPSGLSGKKKGLVVLANYADKSIIYPVSEFEAAFNQSGYSKNNHHGSVHDYFLDQSYGALSIDFDVVGPVTLSQNMSYYGENDKEGNDMYPATMAGEAIRLADSYVNYADYDWDGDGEVDQVFIVYAGYGEASDVQEVMPDVIWQHEWSLSAGQYYGDGSGALFLDGVKIDTYACSSELANDTGTTLDGIGTACHEFSHCLGYPDFYDTGGGDGFGMSYWDVMDAGSYNGKESIGEQPAGYTAYERWFAGWLSPIELTEPGYYELPCLADTAVAYVIYNQANDNEFYLLENRQNKNWYSFPSSAHGMLVTHVDYNEDAWYENSVNNDENHQRMTFVPADGTFTYTSYGLMGDPYPGRNTNTTLSNTSKPAATFYNANSDGKKYLNHTIDQITESNGVITFRFDGGVKLDAPVISEAVLNEEKTALSIAWNAVEEATSYSLLVTKKDISGGESLGTVLSESMQMMHYNSDSNVDVSNILGNFMTYPGWTGSHVYRGLYGAKVGNSKGGYLTSPGMAVSGKLTVNIVLTPYGNDSHIVTLGLANASGEVLETQEVEATGTEQTVVFSKAEPGCKLTITPTKRVYVSSIEMIAGSVSETSQVDGLTDTNYRLTALEPGYIYEISVRASNGTANSAWSESVSVEVAGSTGITTLQLEQPRTAAGFDLMGRPVTGNRQGLSVQQGKIIFIK